MEKSLKEYRLKRCNMANHLSSAILTVEFWAHTVIQLTGFAANPSDKRTFEQPITQLCYFYGDLARVWHILAFTTVSCDRPVFGNVSGLCASIGRTVVWFWNSTLRAMSAL